MPKYRFTIVDEETGDEDPAEVPGRYEICERCRGEGKHTNPAIDGNGITASEWEQDWDEESREAYFAGRYDVRCEEGCIDGKVIVPDKESCSAAQWAAVEDHFLRLHEAARCDAEDRRTRRMESGGYDR